EDNSRCTFSGHMDMHQPVVNWHEASRWRKASPVAPSPNGLVHSTRCQQQGEYAKGNHENHNGRQHAKFLSIQEYPRTRLSHLLNASLRWVTAIDTFTSNG